ncbi:unnamed protein product [Effrenium voratum]|uniref:Uncharacterized protein n=1 Tax=Effrenium voratum TaxID=2562239 RepID=A0AA36IU57_9DINO|nr:unnamed protein product [Effrenium voratum]
MSSTALAGDTLSLLAAGSPRSPASRVPRPSVQDAGSAVVLFLRPIALRRWFDNAAELAQFWLPPWSRPPPPATFLEDVRRGTDSLGFAVASAMRPEPEKGVSAGGYMALPLASARDRSPSGDGGSVSRTASRWP